MDNNGKQSNDTPACGAEQTAHSDLERLRSKVDLQAKAIDYLSKTVAVLEAERSQMCSALSLLQAELHEMARHIAGHYLEERFEALRCEVATELHYLRSLLMPLPGFGPCCPSASCTRPHPTELRNQTAINHVSQELYHSRRILWEQIEELREKVHRIQSQQNLHRKDILKRLTESYRKDMSMQRVIDTCQAQETSIQKLLRQQSENRVRFDVSELQTKLQNTVISKGKAPKKTGHCIKTNRRLLLPSSDSDESSNATGPSAPKAEGPADTTTRRK